MTAKVGAGETARESPAQASLSAEDQRLVNALRQGQRRALAKAITLVESTRADHQARAAAVLDAVLPAAGGSLRIGLTGVPGVGKSTFIEAFGMHLIAAGHRVAVLAIDPSSAKSGGSILGDKTRMERLAQQEAAFIRPTPAAGALGGVAARTREAILLCEAAGFDIVIVETVGVGQSETAVAAMTDVFVLLMLPNAGDDLQAIKRGIMELADLVVFNKADLDALAVERACQQMRAALALFAGDAVWRPPVLAVSALKQDGMAAVWQALQDCRAARVASGEFHARRRRQALDWMWQLIDGSLREHFRRHPAVAAALPETSLAVTEGRLAPSVAARRLLHLMNPHF